MMRFHVRHYSRVKYAKPVQHAQFNLRLSPWPFAGQVVERETLALSPDPAALEPLDGPYLVRTTHARFSAALTSLEVTSEFHVTRNPAPPPASGPQQSEVAEEALAVRDLSISAPVPYLFASRIAEMDDAITQWAAPQLDPGADILACAMALMDAVHTRFTYAQGSTDTNTPPSTAFEQRRGVCQDFAHVMIMALRGHGIPAAYVSGYLRTLPPPGRERLVGADAMHAWVAVWCGRDLGWVGFDPTNNTLARQDHIAIGMGRDYADVSPINGTFIGTAAQSMLSSVDVVAVD